MDDLGDAIERVYRDRYVGFRNALATTTGSRESARDAVQEAFARAYRDRADFRGGSLEAWIWRIALRVALGQANVKTTGAGNDVNGALDPRLLDPELDPELARALRALPPRRRLIVFLRYFADFDYSQIAAACGISEGTVAASLAQARTQLKQLLEHEGVSRR